MDESINVIGLGASQLEASLRYSHLTSLILLYFLGAYVDRGDLRIGVTGVVLVLHFKFLNTGSYDLWPREAK